MAGETDGFPGHQGSDDEVRCRIEAQDMEGCVVRRHQRGKAGI